MIKDRWLFGRKTSSFTLQWHLTNACPFTCRHCYDRSDRNALSLDEARDVLSGFQSFCRSRRVEARLSLSGGDPLAYPFFWDLYREIGQARIPTSILGNPIPASVIERLMRAWRPAIYQVSLEGFREHNDAIRGTGHFDKVMEFLAAARSLGLNVHVMLTLTRANMSQVIPLAEELRGLAARFTFNRLSQVGNGTDLELPPTADFIQFLKDYLAATATNPILGLKENLFNILRERSRRPLLPGCTGFGCGAAFNFVALLPDGEVHACRKFPSLLGNIRETSLDTIYDSPAAKAYRTRPEECRRCRLEKKCGGCLAVSHGHGLTPSQQRDPMCFFDSNAVRQSDRANEGFRILHR